MKSLVLDHKKLAFDQLLPLIDKHAEYLSLNNCGLTNLDNFPLMPNLKKLDLMDNKLTDIAPLAKGCPLLTRLDLSNNKKLTIDALKPLKQCSQLKYLNLVATPLTDTDGKRRQIFQLLPNLLSLDFKTEQGIDVEYSSGEEDSEEEEEDEVSFNEDVSRQDDDQDDEEAEDESGGSEGDESEGDEDELGEDELDDENSSEQVPLKKQRIG